MTTQKAKGVVAAGDRLTAAAGAEVLAHGGNAVDAAIASMTTAFVSEPALTGPLGGGFAVVAGPKSPPKAYHFFANAPTCVLLSGDHSAEKAIQSCLEAPIGSINLFLMRRNFHFLILMPPLIPQ